MVVHLDTSFAIDLLREERRGRWGPAHQMLETFEESPIGVSVFVQCELEDGLAGSTRPEQERATLDAFMSALPIAYPDERFAVRYAQVSTQLRRRAKTVATMDMLIGVMALVEGAVVVTRDVKHFSMIPGLDVRGY